MSDELESARGPRAFAALGVVLVLALCGAGLALARSGEQLRDPAPLVDRLEFRPAVIREPSMPTDWTEDDGTSLGVAGAPFSTSPRAPPPLATRADIAALESRVLALETALASKGIPVTSPK